MKRHIEYRQMRFPLRLIMLLSLITIGTQLIACASPKTVNFSVIYEDNQCTYKDPEILHIQNDKQQALVVQKLLPLREASVKQELSSLLHKHHLTEQLFLLTQGTKPTPGYGFKIMADHAPVEASTLMIPVRFTSPEKGMIMAQVITSPCMIIGVDKTARYNRIQADALHLDITLPE